MGSEVEVAVYGRRWYILLIFSLHAMFQVCTVLYCTVHTSDLLPARHVVHRLEHLGPRPEGRPGSLQDVDHR